MKQTSSSILGTGLKRLQLDMHQSVVRQGPKIAEGG